MYLYAASISNDDFVCDDLRLAAPKWEELARRSEPSSTQPVCRSVSARGIGRPGRAGAYRSRTSVLTLPCVYPANSGSLRLRIQRDSRESQWQGSRLVLRKLSAPAEVAHHYSRPHSSAGMRSRARSEVPVRLAARAPESHQLLVVACARSVEAPAGLWKPLQRKPLQDTDGLRCLGVPSASRPADSL